jgi:hypothetical protein
MSKREVKLGRLPADVRRAARELRKKKPSAELEERLARALARADVEAVCAERETVARPNRFFTSALTVVPLAAAVLVVAHLAYGGGVEQVEPVYVKRFEEMHIDVGTDALRWIGLELASHHHDGKDAFVRIDAPEGVQVMPTEHARPRAPGVSCANERCIHHFRQPNANTARPPVQLGVRGPGRYHVRVEHASDDARVREDFVLDVR